MKIGIDIQGIQSDASRERGIGRYSLNLITHLITLYPDHQYILVANASLTNVESFVSKSISNTSANYSYVEWFAPCPTKKNKFSLGKTRNVRSALYSYTLSSLNLDCLLITSFFEGFNDNALVEFDHSFDLPKIVTIFYDLIPLLKPENYLDQNPFFKKFYLKKIDEIKKLDGFLAISESSAKEACDSLHIDENLVKNISSACDNHLFNTNKKTNCITKSKNLISLEPYLLYAGAGDSRKNLKRLVQAYSLLPGKLRNKYNLVIAGRLLPFELNDLQNFISANKLSQDNIKILGYVSDQELVSLYQNCSLFIFPSLHEGFGLPVLEAISCGAPTIGSNITSIPEILGLDEAMFDPYSVQSITKKIIQFITDKDFQDRLKYKLYERSKLFSWEITSELVINFISTLIERESFSNSKKNTRVKTPFEILKDKYISNSFLLFTLDNKRLVRIISSLDLSHRSIQASKKYFTQVGDNFVLRIEGPFDSDYSLAILNRELALATQQVGQKVLLHSTEGPGDYSPNMNFIREYPGIMQIYSSSRRMKNNLDICTRNLYPPRVNDMKGLRNFIHAFGWEESEVPQQYINDFNNYLDGVSVMSDFVKKILIDNGVEIPIATCGLGTDHINTKDIDKLYKLSAKKRKILHLSSCFPRKGLDILLKAYGQTFSSADNVTLIIKTFPNIHNNVDDLLCNYRKKNPQYPDVIVIKDSLSISEIKSLYLQSDVLIAPSYGEGFAFPVAEAMQLKIPVITTAWGGQMDYCNSDNCWLIDYNFSYSKTHFNLYNSYWAEPSVSNLSDLLNKFFKLSKDEIKLKTDIAYKDISAYTWERVALRNLHFIRTIKSKRYKKKSHFAVMTTWNTRCGIAAYSHNIVRYFTHDVTIFAPINEDKDNTEGVIRNWDLDSNSPSNYDSILNKIDELDITTLMIQFNYGFYEFDTFNKFLDSILKKKVKVIITLHSTTDPDNSRKKLVYLKNNLSKCDRLLVHSISDLNRLKTLGIVENVTLINHPILHSINYEFHTFFNIKRTFRRFLKTSFKIASFGFCLPNKGFEELLYSIYQLRLQNYPVELSLYASKYSEDYQWYLDNLNELLISLKISDYVTIDNNFLPDEQVLMKLSANDLLVFPYQLSNESSSASVRYGLSSGVPVLVTPSPIFEDVDNYVQKTRGFSANDIAQGISDFFDANQHLNEYNTKMKMSDRKKYIEYNSYSNFSSRLQSMIRAIENNN